jgi:dolichol-phosphate mannosyltransferase
MQVSVVIPTYNERENIKELVPEIFEVFRKNGIKGNLIVVDDSSPDGTAGEVERLGEKYPIILVKRDGKQGIGSAYVAGFRKALEIKSDAIFEMDADLSHDPEYIPEFLGALEDSDMVLGSRYIKGGRIENWGHWRKMVSKGANITARVLLGLRINDVTTGYRAYKREVLRGMDLNQIKSGGYVFQAEILLKVMENGFRIKEVPITFVDRKKGTSKLSRKEMLNFLMFCLKSRCI